MNLSAARAQGHRFSPEPVWSAALGTQGFVLRKSSLFVLLPVPGSGLQVPCYDVWISPIGALGRPWRSAENIFTIFPEISPDASPDMIRARRALAGLLVCAALALTDTGPYLRPVASARPTRTELAATIRRGRLGEARVLGLGQGLKAGCRDCAALASALGSRTRGGSSTTLGGLAADLANHLDRGIETLERAAAQDPTSAGVQADLAAARLARHRSGGRATDLVLALVAADRAVFLDPSLPEGRFNLALSLEGLGLDRQAITAWVAYLRIDPDSSWADEADARLRRLTLAPTVDEAWLSERSSLDQAIARSDSRAVLDIVRRFRQSARLYAEDLLSSWATAWLQGDRHRADQTLGLARAVGRAVNETSGDRMVADSVEALDQGLVRGNLGRVRAEAEGYQEYGLAVQLYKRDRDAEALPHFVRARRLLTEAGTPFRHWATIREGVCLVFLGRFERFDGELLALTAGDALAVYPVARGRLETALGMAYGKAASLGRSLAHYQQALDLFARAGEEENFASLHFMIGEVLRLQGEGDEAWQHRHQAIRLLRHDRGSIYFHNSLFDAVGSCLEGGQPRAALYFEGEMIDAGVAQGDALRNAESLLGRSRTRRRTGDDEGADRDLDAAEEWLTKSPAGAKRERLGSSLGLDRGERYLAADPAVAEAALTRSIELGRESGERFMLPWLYGQRASVRQALGDDGAAEQDFAAALDEVEVQHARAAEALQDAFLDRTHSLFSAAVSFEVEKGRARQAFDYEERFRAQDPAGMADLPGSAGASDTDQLPALQGQLAGDQALVEYLVAEQSTFACVVTSSAVDCLPLPEGDRQLRREIEVFRSAITHRADEAVVARQGSHLYEVLVRPLAPFLSDATALVLVTDGVLDALPFAALVDSDSGRYLLERWSTVRAPSASLFVRAARKLGAQGFAQATATVVGDPAVATARFDALEDLPDALTEARTISSIL